MTGQSQQRRPLLFAAHPGHELRLFAWCQRNKPDLCLLTTGARNAESGARTNASAALLDQWGGNPGPLFGAAPDRDIYRFILDGDAAPFNAWTETLADWIARTSASTLVVDAWQGYNPAHDLAHIMGRCAAKLAAERTGRAVSVLEFPVVPEAMAPESQLNNAAIAIELTAKERELKHAAIQWFPEIADERAELMPYDAGECETLHQPRPLSQILAAYAPQPRYESYGEARVTAGLYATVLRRAHVLAIAHALDAAFLRALPATA